jgi:hypothetical protein
MPSIKPRETITTSDPRIEITPTRDAPLPEGTYGFELVVEDDQGKTSPPVSVKVVVKKTLPDAVLKGPESVEENSSFTLDGTGSAAVSPAQLTRYHWTLASADSAVIEGGLPGSDKA